MNQHTGKYIILLGLIILLAGILIYCFHDKFRWLGRLPGDIRIERKNFSFYFPFTTMVIVSIVLTVLFRLFRKF